MKHILTILAVEDVAASAAFYDRAFGWDRSVDVPVYIEYTLPDGSCVGLYDRAAFAKNTGIRPSGVPSGAITCTELYFRCDDLAAAIDEALAGKATIASPAASLRRGAFLAEMGYERLTAGEGQSPAALRVTYLRPPVVSPPKR